MCQSKVLLAFESHLDIELDLDILSRKLTLRRAAADSRNEIPIMVTAEDGVEIPMDHTLPLPLKGVSSFLLKSYLSVRGYPRHRLVGFDSLPSRITSSRCS